MIVRTMAAVVPRLRHGLFVPSEEQVITQQSLVWTPKRQRSLPIPFRVQIGGTLFGSRPARPILQTAPGLLLDLLLTRHLVMAVLFVSQQL